MKHIAWAYGRALFPRRFTSRGLAPGTLELDLAAGIYRLVVAVERLVDALGERRVRPRADRHARAAGGAHRRRAGCG